MFLLLRAGGFILLAATGMRRGEVLGISLDDVDLDDAQESIPITGKKGQGRGSAFPWHGRPSHPEAGLTLTARRLSGRPENSLIRRHTPRQAKAVIAARRTPESVGAPLPAIGAPDCTQRTDRANCKAFLIRPG
jgi:integrase